MLLQVLIPCWRCGAGSPTQCCTQPSCGHDAARSITAQPIFLLPHRTVTKTSKSIIFLQLFVYFFSPSSPIFNRCLWVGGLGAPNLNFNTEPIPIARGQRAKGHGTNCPLWWCHEVGMAGCHSLGHPARLEV